MADSLQEKGISEAGSPFSVEAFRRQAVKVPFYGSSDEDFQRMIQEISSVATRGRAMLDASKRFAAPRPAGASAPQTTRLARGGGASYKLVMN
jgi:hypothetical protein